MQCPECGHESDGAFCPRCGTRLAGPRCPECGARLDPDARFCTKCGEPVAASRGGFRSPAPWIALTVVAGIVIVAVVLQLDRGARRTAPDLPAGTPAETQGARPTAEDPMAGGPLAAGDRLFDRIMTEMERGDTSQARFFVPMALQSYELAAPLDDDRRYHVGLIHLVNGDPEAARAAVEPVLADNPDHLLALKVAAEAEALMGDSAAARRLYQRLLDHYEEESARPLVEYEAHGRVLPIYRDEAEAFLAGRPLP